MSAFQRRSKSKFNGGGNALKKLLNATHSGSPTRGLSGLKLEAPPPNPSARLIRGKSFNISGSKKSKSSSNPDTSGSRKLSLAIFGIRRQSKSDRRRSSSSKGTTVTARSWHGSGSSISILSSSLSGAPVGPDSRCVRLLSMGRWEALRLYLTTDAGYSDAVRAINLNRGSSGTKIAEARRKSDLSLSCHGTRPAPSRRTSINQPILLHLALKQYPPLDIIERIVEIMESSSLREDYNAMDTLDSSGRTPLHTAAAWGASPHVVRYLLRKDPTATMRLDHEGKTPLHLCCENCCCEGSCDDGSRKIDGDLTLVKGPMLSVLNMLAKACPEAIHTEDCTDMVPLEHAILNGANVSAVKLLQKLSVTEWKKTERDQVKRSSIRRGSQKKDGGSFASARDDENRKEDMSAVEAAAASLCARRASASSNDSKQDEQQTLLVAANAAKEHPLRQKSATNAAA